MKIKAEKEKLIEVLKFTPRTYKIQLWGYGGEYIMGTVDRKIYDYFKQRRLDLSDFAWDSEYAEDNHIPEEMWPFPPGSYYDCDDMCHEHGVDRNAGTLQIMNENEEVVYEKRLADISGMGADGDEPEPEWGGGEEYWIGMKPVGTVVFFGVSNEKGTFFEGEIELKQPFDASKLELGYDEIDGNDIINSVKYDGEQIDNWGGDTSGKSSEFGFYLVKDSNTWDKYTNMDDIKYEMTEWYPKKIKPVRLGVYMVKTAGKINWTHQAKWTGSKWVSSYTEEDNYDNPAYEVKIKEWQGLAADPDADVEWDAAAELQKIIDNSTFEEGWLAALESTLEDLGKDIGAKETIQPQTGWPFPGPATTENAITEELKSRWWTVRTHYKKSCEQHEYFVQNKGKGRIKVVDGFRFCTYNVETNDGEFPKFEFATVPGGNGKKDSIDMNSINGANIETSELVEMFDGGCWGETKFEGLTLEQEEELEEFLSENGSYALEDNGEWYLEDTEVWVWGPLEVEDDEGNVRIVVADENGNMVDFVDE